MEIEQELAQQALMCLRQGVERERVAYEMRKRAEDKWNARFVIKEMKKLN